MSQAGKPESQPLLEVSDLKVWFPIKKGILRRTVGHIRAVDGVDLSIIQGTTHALVGESGCGKTTVGRAILRLLEPQAGQVRVGGQNILELTPKQLGTYRRRMQMIFQDPMTSLDPRFRVGELVAEGMESFGIGRNGAERTLMVQSLLSKVKLEPEHLNRYPHEFSGGQRQRLGLARALAVEPELIICDEAVSALDVSIQAQMLNLLSSLQRELGLTYLFITHDLSVVRYLSHTVSVMYLGQIVETAATEALFSEPLHPYTQALLAAVPSTDPEHRRVKAIVEGDVPSPAHPPSGCRFHPRCPHAMERCKTDCPPLYELSPHRKSRCFLADGKGSVSG